MKNRIALPLGVTFVGFIFLLYAGYKYFYVSYPKVDPIPLWEYQCVDTMKASRDRARGWNTAPDLQARIAAQMQTIKSVGANCVSIGTPYDEEFIPYMTVWVSEARKQNLRVWFRGNFSGWEEWFDYPKLTDTNKHSEQIREFILTNPQLFQDGDIFTPAPEAENGGPFQAGNASQYELYRQFLKQSYSVCQDAFATIQKTVTCNWFSMSGGHAKSIFTQDFARSIDSVVTIDHYVRDSRDMGEFITYFAKNYKSKLVLGEFGAPIPDLNGEMNQEQQRIFVEHLMKELYENRDTVQGINYWTLTEGSTRLLNDDGSERPVVDLLRDYYQPGVVVGRVVDGWGSGVANAFVQVHELRTTVYTDNNGYFVINLPAGSYTIAAFNAQLQSDDQSVIVTRNQRVTILLRT